MNSFSMFSDKQNENEIRKKLVDFKGTFVFHTEVMENWEKLKQLYHYGAMPGGSTQVTLTGPSRTGKSELLSVFTEEMNREYGDSFTSGVVPDVQFKSVPVLYVETPSKATLKTLASATLTELLGHHVSTRESEASLVSRVRKALNYHKTRVLIFDEFQHLTNHGQLHSRSGHSPAADFIKTLLNSGETSIVLAGMPEVRGVVKGDKQVLNRGWQNLTLDRFRLGSKKSHQRFVNCLKDFEDSVPLPNRYEFSTPEMAIRLHYATDGLIGLVSQLLRISIQKALEQGQDSLSYELIAYVYREQMWAEGKEDPFSCDKEKLKNLFNSSIPDNFNDDDGSGKNKRKAPKSLSEFRAGIY
ncbi:TniB family NTP-binding protein [Fodinicurvata halophila]|uniref:TniB family NTP-binding protein n=1 Tax=Fodinicurvata halophila TaxID=1419723 RepID=A0ABV8UNW7_9PROT